MAEPTPESLKTWARIKFALAASGVFLGLVLLIVIVRLRPRLVNRSLEFLSTTESALATTRSGLSIAGSSLETVLSGLEEAVSSLDALESSLDELPRLNEKIGGLLDGEISQFTAESEAALRSAAASSRLIDNALGMLAKIPLIGLDYRPQIPLETSLGDLADSFGEMPANLAVLRTDLDQSAASLAGLAASTSQLSGELNQLNEDLKNMQPLLDNYADQFTAYNSQLQELKQSLPRWVNGISAILALLLIWFVINQSLRGFELWQGAYSGKIAGEKTHTLTKVNEE